MDQVSYAKLMDTVLSLEPVRIIERKGFRIANVSWSDNLRAVWTVPTGQALDTDYDHLGIDRRAYTLRRESDAVVALFAAERPDQDVAVFSEAGAPAAVAVATVKAFRDWRSDYGSRIAVDEV